jgi:hypothetical protein
MAPPKARATSHRGSVASNGNDDYVVTTAAAAAEFLFVGRFLLL